METWQGLCSVTRCWSCHGYVTGTLLCTPLLVLSWRRGRDSALHAAAGLVMETWQGLCSVRRCWSCHGDMAGTLFCTPLLVVSWRRDRDSALYAAAGLVIETWQGLCSVRRCWSCHGDVAGILLCTLGRRQQAKCVVNMANQTVLDTLSALPLWFCKMLITHFVFA